MKNGNARRRLSISTLILIGTFVIAAAAFIVPVYSVHSSSLSAGSAPAKSPVASARTSQVGSLSALKPAIHASSGSFLPIPADSPETIETFAADCTTPRTTFVLGETVCAVVNYVTESDRFVNWISPPDSNVAFSSPTIPDNLTHSYSYIPTVTGTWKATIADPSDSSINPTYFDVVAAGPVATYAAGCTVPQVVFNLGTDVCAKVTGGLAAPRRIAWIDPAGYIRQITAISSDPQDDTFSVPGTATSTLSNGVEVPNVGSWRVSVISSRGSLVSYSTFFVSDPANASANISVSKTVPNEGGEVSAGSTTVFTISVYNAGPSTAHSVVLTDVLPSNTTFISIAPAAGCTTPGLGGTGTITCSVADLPRGSTATYDVSLNIVSGTSPGTLIANTVTVSSATADPFADDNTFTAYVRVVDNGTAACTLNCPSDMTVEANTTQAGEPGAIVNFPAASGIGNCGAISNSPGAKQPDGSDTFFALGTHLITSMSESGDSCTFTLTVVNTPPPTIACPVDKTVTAASGASSANVAVGTPTTSPSSGVTVVGIRSDDPNCTDTEVDPGCTPVPLTDPYPLGTTTITWTVIQSNGQKASCTQRITVVENNCGEDTEAPTITAPPDVTIGTGPDPTISKFCSVGLDDELGQPEAHDNCSFNISTSGIPANNAFPVGTTTVTYTATDPSGNHASAVQHVTVFDNTPPIIVAPPDASYTCLSDVPAGAAAIALARGDNPALPNGGPPTDNCGAPVVTYSDSSSGAGSVASPRIITRTYVATDTSPLHNSSSAVQTITVIDPTPPTITLTGANPQYVECHTPYPELGATANDNCGNFAATPSGSVNVNVPGTYTITYDATDWAGNAATPVSRTVIVQDTIAPTINLTGYAPSMWPPNHKYSTFQLTQFVSGVTDSCDTSLGISGVVIEKVTSDEIENGNGDGNTLNDIVIAADCKSVQLRSEREGNSNGRVYTITFKVQDASGNVGHATVKVVVQHNPGETAIDSGVHYTVNGTCP